MGHILSLQEMEGALSQSNAPKAVSTVSVECHTYEPSTTTTECSYLCW
jgi:hypothetical protein